MSVSPKQPLSERRRVVRVLVDDLRSGRLREHPADYEEQEDG
jgi:hypothetical protein